MAIIKIEGRPAEGKSFCVDWITIHIPCETKLSLALKAALPLINTDIVISAEELD